MTDEKDAIVRWAAFPSAVLDLQGRFVRVSDGLAALLGQSCEALAGRAVTEFLAAESRDLLRLPAPGAAPEQVDLAWLVEEGRSRPMSTAIAVGPGNSFVLQVYQGSVWGSVDALLTQSPLGLVILRRGLIVDLSVSLAALFGTSRRILKGRPFTSLLTEAWTSGVDSAIASLEHGEDDVLRATVEVLTPAGGRWVDLVASRMDIDGLPSILCFVVDSGTRLVIEQGQARVQQALERAAAEWRVTFDAVENPIVILTTGLKVSRINRAARMISGLSFEDLVGKRLDAALRTREPWKTIESLARETFAKSATSAAQIRDETGRVWDFLGILENLPGGERRVIVLGWDVTQVIELQTRIDQNRSMAAMGSLVAGVAHEVRNPLFAISATVDALEQAARGEFTTYFEVLQEEIGRMTLLMQDLLEFGKPRAMNMSRHSVGTIVRSAVHDAEQVAVQRSVALALEIDSDMTMTLDADRMRRAVVNVVQNGVQHSPAGSVVTASVRDSDDREEVTILVRDSGPGFDESTLSQVFEPFFSKRKGGTGLGLAIVQQIVNEHGGRVEARNHPEGGGEVVITLPRYDRPGEDA